MLSDDPEGLRGDPPPLPAETAGDPYWIDVDMPAPAHVGLSTDYLNHYGGILMLIEMAAFDQDAVADLTAWRPIGYRDYFRLSPLRWAPRAIAAYDALPDEKRTSFEQTIQALDKLAAGAILALQPPCHPQNVALIANVISPTVRRLIDRAAAFINSHGTTRCDACEDPQVIIDQLIA